MFRKRKNENMAYGVIGLGRFGYALATELAGSGAELLVIDKDEDKVRVQKLFALKGTLSIQLLLH